MGTALYDRKRGLYLDGLRITDDGVHLERAIYTYNQGPILGALVALGGAANLARASALTDAVARHLTIEATRATCADDGTDRQPVVTHGGGDAGLFSGILIRYLTEAAMTTALPPPSRRQARDIVLDTAEVLWQGRDESRTVFSHSTAVPAAAAYPPGAVVELSTQLQAWMILECAAKLSHNPERRSTSQAK
jgi:predicted alpha-1,6-mannanase (GH76 family)